MNDASLTPDIAAAASTAATSPSLHLLPLGSGEEGDGEVEGEGFETLTDRVVAVGNGGGPFLPPCPLFSLALPTFSLSASLSLVCCSHSASSRPEN